MVLVPPSPTHPLRLAKRVGNRRGMWVISGFLNDTLGAFFGVGGVISGWKGGRIGLAWGMDLSTSLSKVVPLLSVMALAFSLGFINSWEGNLPNPCVLISPISLAICPICNSKFLMEAWVVCLNCIEDVAKAFTKSSKDGF